VLVIVRHSAAVAAEHVPCDSLSAANAFGHTTISSAKAISAGEMKGVPALCEITAVVEPVAGSRIGVVYRLPDAWNGKLLGLGGGGWAGNVRMEAAAPGLARGYATAQTDGGHATTEVWDTSWAANPEAAADFAYRAIHVMTDVGKAVVAKYYGHSQSRAYFQGCSTGGRQALMEVQRYPSDYNGVIAGAPVYSLATQTSAVLRNQAFARDGAAITAAQITRLNNAALAACDMQDGLADGIITDPRACTFDPGKLLCKEGAATADCLSAAQVAAVRTMYTGIKTSKGEIAAYPLTRGGEAGWSRFVGTTVPASGVNLSGGAQSAGLGGLRAILFGNADYDLNVFDADKDYATVRGSAFAKAYEAADPDIAAFIRHGGKLLLWHGFDDPGPSPLATIDYFQDVQRATGPKVKALASGARLFIAPGVYHCRGGPGPDEFDLLGAIDTWVEKGQAPATLLATKSGSPVSRPLCPYPALPRYKGKGDPNAAASFVCK
jgi:feruloyl esterase